MTITLSPELADAVQQAVANGRYRSAEEYVASAVQLLRERHASLDENLDCQRDALEAAWQESESGQVIDLQDARKELQAMKADFDRVRQSA